MKKYLILTVLLCCASLQAAQTPAKQVVNQPVTPSDGESVMEVAINFLGMAAALLQASAAHELEDPATAKLAAGNFLGNLKNLLTISMRNPDLLKSLDEPEAEEQVANFVSDLKRKKAITIS